MNDIDMLQAAIIGRAVGAAVGAAVQAQQDLDKWTAQQLERHERYTAMLRARGYTVKSHQGASGYVSKRPAFS